MTGWGDRGSSCSKLTCDFDSAGLAAQSWPSTPSSACARLPGAGAPPSCLPFGTFAKHLLRDSG